MEEIIKELKKTTLITASYFSYLMIMILIIFMITLALSVFSCLKPSAASADDFSNPVYFNPVQIGKYGTSWRPKKNYVQIKITSSALSLFSMGCYIKTSSGKEYLDFVKFDKKGRQTYITNYTCENYTKIEFVCEEEKQKVVFSLRGKKRLAPCKKI